MTKSQAIAQLKALGYTVLFDTSSSGDYGYGSRLYFKHPEAPVNQYGYPLRMYGTVSKVKGNQWQVGVFQ